MSDDLERSWNIIGGISGALGVAAGVTGFVLMGNGHIDVGFPIVLLGAFPLLGICLGFSVPIWTPESERRAAGRRFEHGCTICNPRLAMGANEMCAEHRAEFRAWRTTKGSR